MIAVPLLLWKWALERARKGMYYLYYLFIAGLVIVCDQLTKIWIVQNFQMYEAREIIPSFFNLVYVVNTGAAFSMFADVDSPWRHYFFVGIAFVACIGLTYMVSTVRRENPLFMVSLACIAGGAIGNLIDRLYYGHVVDFLDVYFGSYHWPAFNVADSAICVGAVLYVVLSFFQARAERKKA